MCSTAVRDCPVRLEEDACLKVCDTNQPCHTSFECVRAITQYCLNPYHLDGETGISNVQHPSMMHYRVSLPNHPCQTLLKSLIRTVSPQQEDGAYAALHNALRDFCQDSTHPLAPYLSLSQYGAISSSTRPIREILQPVVQLSKTTTYPPPMVWRIAGELWKSAFEDPNAIKNENLIPSTLQRLPDLPRPPSESTLPISFPVLSLSLKLTNPKTPLPPLDPKVVDPSTGFVIFPPYADLGIVFIPLRPRNGILAPNGRSFSDIFEELVTQDRTTTMSTSAVFMLRASKPVPVSWGTSPTPLANSPSGTLFPTLRGIIDDCYISSTSYTAILRLKSIYVNNALLSWTGVEGWNLLTPNTSSQADFQISVFQDYSTSEASQPNNHPLYFDTFTAPEGQPAYVNMGTALDTGGTSVGPFIRSLCACHLSPSVYEEYEKHQHIIAGVTERARVETFPPCIASPYPLLPPSSTSETERRLTASAPIGNPNPLGLFATSTPNYPPPDTLSAVGGATPDSALYQPATITTYVVGSLSLGLLVVLFGVLLTSWLLNLRHQKHAKA